MMDESNLGGLVEMVGTLTPSTDAQVVDATAFVGRHALDAADRSAILAALGLDAA